MTTAACPLAARPVPDVAPSSAVATPSIGSVARARLASDTASALQWLAVLPTDSSAAQVNAALDALSVLRTDLRSLRPILDKDWTVSLRDGLDAATELLTGVRRLDGQVRLLVDCEAEGSAPGRALLDELVERRGELVAAIGGSIDASTTAGLISLASGLRPAPLRAGAPIGDPDLPAECVLPAMLHRRWRKLVNETPVGDLESMHRRAAELLVVLDLATRGDLEVPGLWSAAAALRASAARALGIASAQELKERLPSCPVRKKLAQIVRRGAWTAHGIEQDLARVSKLGRRLPADDRTPAKVAAGGLVVRPGTPDPEVLLVHRVRHDDWSIPKGAALPGETAEMCAAREVREETGLRCRLGPEVHSVVYRDRNNRAKHVRFWQMTPLEGTGAPDPAEVDETRWVPLSSAESLLTRKRDHRVVRAYRRDRDRPDQLAC